MNGMTNPTPPRLYLDANIFIAAFETRNERVLSLFLNRPKASGAFLFTSLLTKAELLVIPYRNRDDRLITVYENWMESNDILSVGPIDGDALQYAAVLRAQYPSLKLPDAIHLSTAVGFECSHFVSFDQQFQNMPSIAHFRYGVVQATRTPMYISPSDGFFSQLTEQLLS
jgi:predicted nucleic acid-binding protein